MADEQAVGGPNRRLLVIDDDAMVRATLRDILEEAGFEVIEAADGERGLAAFDRTPVDLVITDILMPGKEGIETIVELRRRHLALPIIAVSGGGATHNLEFLRFAKQLGADRILAKPIGADDLVQAVREVLAVVPPVR